MAFVWKESSSIWKGEGIYHLTFAVTDRLPLLGTLQPLGATGPQSLGTVGAQPLGTAGCFTAPSRLYTEGVQRPNTTDGNTPPATDGHTPPTCPKHTTHLAWVELTPLGLEVSRQLQHIGETVPGLALCAKQIMPDHIHVVLWVKQDTGRSIRQIGNGFPLVVLLLDGFPAPGTEAERYYHPSGVYHTACGEGRLLLLAPQPDNYSNPDLIARTEEELIRKAQQKGQTYHPLPHTTKRWLMVAGNCMLRMIEAEI